MDVLAAIRICTNDVTTTFFCDEEGYDIISMNMVNFVLMEKVDEVISK